MPTGSIDYRSLRSALEPHRVGRSIEWRAETNSTNEWAWEFVHDDSADGLVVVTEFQHAGRGRLGRSWMSPRGASLLFSVLLLDHHKSLGGPALSLLAAVACARAISSTTQLICSIKWPNDLLVSGKKVGGILVESRTRSDGTVCYVLGIGINCLQHVGHFPPELVGIATSLEIECAAAIKRTALLLELLKMLDGWLANPRRWREADLREEWLDRCESMGRRVQLQHAHRVYSGTMIDVDPSAGMLVQLDEGGIRRFDASDTTVLSP